MAKHGLTRFIKSEGSLTLALKRILSKLAGEVDTVKGKLTKVESLEHGVGNRLLSGGAVSLENGYDVRSSGNTFYVSNLRVLINDKIYETAATTITAEPGDAITYGHIVVQVDSEDRAHVTYVSTPSTFPEIDAATQAIVTSLTVPANTSDYDPSATIIYDAAAAGSATVSGSTNVATDSPGTVTILPVAIGYTGSDMVEFDSAVQEDYLALTEAGDTAIGDLLVGSIRLLSRLPEDWFLRVACFDASGDRISNWVRLDGSIGLDETVTEEWQSFAIPKGLFAPTQSTYRSLRFEVQGPGSGTFDAFLDAVAWHAAYTVNYEGIGGDVDASLIDHDALLNYVADEHIDWTGATVDFNTTGNVLLGSTLPTIGKIRMEVDDVIAWRDAANIANSGLIKGGDVAGADALQMVGPGGTGMYITGSEIVVEMDMNALATTYTGQVVKAATRIETDSIEDYGGGGAISFGANNLDTEGYIEASGHYVNTHVNGSVGSFIYSGGDTPVITMSHGDNTAGDHNYISVDRSRGTWASPTAVQSGDNIFGIYAGGYNSTLSSAVNAAQVVFSVDGAPTAFHVPGKITFSVNDGTGMSPALEIQNDGTIDLQSGNIRTGGDLLFDVAGKGIDWSNSQTPTAASGATTTGEVISNYEEGTWSPTLTTTTSGSYTYTSNGYYTRVGRKVTLHGYINITGESSPVGNLQIGGFPFNHGFSDAAAGGGYATFVTCLSTTAGFGGVTLRSNGANDHCRLLIYSQTTGIARMQATEFGASGDFYFVYEYLT